MKRKAALVFAALLAFALFSGFTEGQKVYDNANLLSEGERESLEAECISIANELKFDVVLLTADNAEGKSSMEYADDFYDQNGFGYDKPQGDGLLMLIDMDNRNVWISTCGAAQSEVDDYVIDQMLDNLYPSLTGGDYTDAFFSFLKDLRNYKQIRAEYESGSGYNPPKPSPETDYYVDDGKGGYTPAYPETKPQSFNHFVALIASAVISLIVVISMVKGAGGSKASVASGLYLNHAATKLNFENDSFINKTITVRHIPPPPSNSGGGGGFSGHTSSGGVSHGGGGRSF